MRVESCVFIGNGREIGMYVNPSMLFGSQFRMINCVFSNLFPSPGYVLSSACLTDSAATTQPLPTQHARLCQLCPTSAFEATSHWLPTHGRPSTRAMASVTVAPTGRLLSSGTVSPSSSFGATEFGDTSAVQHTPLFWLSRGLQQSPAFALSASYGPTLVRESSDGRETRSLPGGELLESFLINESREFHPASFFDFDVSRDARLSELVPRTPALKPSLTPSASVQFSNRSEDFLTSTLPRPSAVQLSAPLALTICASPDPDASAHDHTSAEASVIPCTDAPNGETPTASAVRSSNGEQGLLVELIGGIAGGVLAVIVVLIVALACRGREPAAVPNSSDARETEMAENEATPPPFESSNIQGFPTLWASTLATGDALWIDRVSNYE
jgi:hypothetical protein